MSSKKPISFFIPALNGGGAQKVVVNLANALVRIVDNPIHIVLAKAEGVFLDDLDPSIVVVDLGSKRALRSIFPLAGYLRKSRPEVLCSSLNYANIVSIVAWLISGKPSRLVVREDNVVRRPSGKFLKYLSETILILLMRVLYPYADKVVAISDEVLETIDDANIRVRASSVVIGNPVLLIPTSLTSTPGWLPNPRPRIICSIGRLVYTKGFDVLLDAFSIVDDKIAHLVIFGQGPEQENLEEQARALGISSRVHFPGFVKGPASWLSSKDIFVLPSRWEGFGLVLVEALAAGVPIVATDCPGAPKSLLNDGALGCLVPVGDAEALAKGIERSLKNPVGTAEDRIKKAEEFSPEKIAELYLEKALTPEMSSSQS